MLPTKTFLPIILISSIVLGGCTNTNARLANGESQVYIGGLVNQKVNGDAEFVSVWNLWSAADGLPLAAQHCQQYGRSGAEIIEKRGITAYYRCTKMSPEAERKIFDSAAVKESISKITQCIRQNVAFFDDLVSDARTIALAVAQQCTVEMNEFVDSYISEMPGPKDLSESYVDTLKSNFSEGEKDRVLPYVLAWRSLIKRGWDKAKPPTAKEAPDQLFYRGA